ncbi:hypothetical protein [Mesorhizobium sp. IMUNJ 23232]|uniref:hypothetical protein n=1 Tax=Mesorhizobium sp. IMUNJ 23232 TaxID=3376064 RepID=UPI0037A48139
MARRFIDERRRILAGVTTETPIEPASNPKADVPRKKDSRLRVRESKGRAETGAGQGLGIIFRDMTQEPKGIAETVAKNSKNFEIVVDTLKGGRLYTPHQRRR